MNSCVLPTVPYGSQTWALTKKEEEKIRVAQNNMERNILRIKKMDRVRITTIKARISWGVDFVKTAKRVKWDWAGHVERQGGERWTYRLRNWFLKEGRKKEKQKLGWEDEIIRFLGYNKLFHRVAYDRQEGGLCP